MLPSKLDDSISEANVENIICYSEQFLTIFVKTNQSHLSYRDRSYQNGDGFHFVLANPTLDGSASREFYVIGISPLTDSWKQKFIWYKNVDLAGTPLKESTLKQVQVNGEHIIYVQIPWHEIEPIQGLLYKKYGFNLSYVQATENGTNIYMLKDDPNIQNEQSPREYLEYEFQKPETPKQSECNIQLSKKHCEQSLYVSVNIAINSSHQSLYKVTVYEDNKVIFEDSFEASQGLSKKQIKMDNILFDVGIHKLIIEVSSREFSFEVAKELFVYKQDKFDGLSEEILKIAVDHNILNLRNESINSINFYNKHLNQLQQELKDYECFESIDTYYNKIIDNLGHIKSGGHLFKTGEVVRLGHLSNLDNTLQPYSLYIPSDLDNISNRKLFVFLHGSGSDDTVINYSPLLQRLSEETNSILLSPFARGTSHMYSTEEAIEDVVELTRKISKLFTIEEENIALGGFSMGGYGTYRIFDYAPLLYKRLVIISGHPSLGKPYGGPDYTDVDIINRFKDIPMIVFHGAEDLNCGYEEQIPFFEDIKELNKACEIHIKDDVGHCGLIDEWYPLLINWIKN